MLTTNKGRVMTHRLRKKAVDFAGAWLSGEEFATVAKFIESMKQYHCEESIYASVTFKPEILARFKEYLGNPKRGVELHYEDLYIAWSGAIRGEQII